MIFAVACLPTRAFAAEVILFGDERLANQAGPLRDSLADAGIVVDVDDAAVVGASAASAAGLPQQLADRVAANADARWVILSLGDVDFRRDFLSRTADDIRTANTTNLQTIFDALFVRSPNIRVVLFGPDWGNYVTTSACQTEGTMLFGAMTTTRQINERQQRAVGEAYTRIADQYANVDYVDLFGTLQRDAGVNGAPDPGQPTPAGALIDCRLPTTTAFRVLADALVLDYWGAARPRARPVIMPSPTCVAQPTMFTSISTAAVQNEWRIDGALTSTAVTFVTSFNAVGIRQIALTSANRAFTSSTAVSLVVLPCAAPDAGLADGGLDAGMVDASMVPDANVDAGMADTGVFPDVGAVDTGIVPDAGIVDAGIADTGMVPDAGMADTGMVPDAGMADTGMVPDASTPADTGVVADAGPIDTGFIADAGTGVDRINIEGAGCGAGPHPTTRSGAPVWALLGLVTLLGGRGFGQRRG
ncbi:MAG: hypothetical protein AAF449_05680 [Myxococcota bacterium]